MCLNEIKGIEEKQRGNGGEKKGRKERDENKWRERGKESLFEKRNGVRHT